MIYARIAGALALAALLFFGVRWCVRTVDQAGKYRETVEQLEHERAQNAVNITAIARDISESERDRKSFAGVIEHIDTRFDGIKIPPAAVLVQTKEKAGDPCPTIGVSPQFVGVYNEAAAAAGPAEAETR